MNRTQFNRAFELQNEESTQYLINLLNGTTALIKVEDLGTLGTVHVIDEDGNRYKAIERLLTFYEVPQPRTDAFGEQVSPHVADGATILVDDKEMAYDKDVHFWIAPKAMWVAISANKEAKAPFTPGITILISPDLVNFIKTDVRSALTGIAAKMNQPVDKLFNGKPAAVDKGVMTFVQNDKKGVTISIDGLTIKKVTTYVLARVSDAASVIGFFLTSGFKEKFEKESDELKKFVKAREDHLGK